MKEPDQTLVRQTTEAYLDAYFQLKSRYFRVMISLFAASAPQALLYSSYLEPWASPRLGPLWILVGLVPWLAYFAVTFIRVPPPIKPRTFRRIMLFITCWYTIDLAVLALLAIISPRPVNLRAPYEEAVLWACALLGCVALPSLLRCSRALGEVAAAS